MASFPGNYLSMRILIKGGKGGLKEIKRNKTTIPPPPTKTHKINQTKQLPQLLTYICLEIKASPMRP